MGACLCVLREMTFGSDDRVRWVPGRRDADGKKDRTRTRMDENGSSTDTRIEHMHRQRWMHAVRGAACISVIRKSCLDAVVVAV